MSFSSSELYLLGKHYLFLLKGANARNIDQCDTNAIKDRTSEYMITGLFFPAWRLKHSTMQKKKLSVPKKKVLILFKQIMVNFKVIMCIHKSKLLMHAVVGDSSFIYALIMINDNHSSIKLTI